MLILTALQSACSQEDSPATIDDGETLKLELQLSLPLVPEADTRVTGGALPVNDVWVIQYIEGNSISSIPEEQSSKMIKKSYADASVSWNAAKGRYVVDDTDAIPVFRNKNSMFYVIANANTDAAAHTGLDALNESSTPDDLKALTKEIINVPDDVVTNTTLGVDPQLLVAGPVAFEAKTGGNDNTTAILVAPLKRAYSRFTINWKFEADVFGNASFTTTSLTVKNLPKQMALLERIGNESSSYPLTGNLLGSEILLYDGSNPPTPDTHSVTFYMAENLRGLGSSATAPGKNLPAN